jgi:hypothetical protein
VKKRGGQGQGDDLFPRVEIYCPVVADGRFIDGVQNGLVEIIIAFLLEEDFREFLAEDIVFP